MLNLQTITEELGTKCQGRAWVVVTSQEDIEAVVGTGGFGKDNSKDFSKIQGRFNTRLSLSGSNADEVIQRRLLSKEEEPTKALTARPRRSEALCSVEAEGEAPPLPRPLDLSRNGSLCLGAA